MTVNHKLRVVIRHEFLTTVKQPSFWISLIALPLVMALIITISYFANSSDKPDIDTAKKNRLHVTVIDRSGLIAPEVAKTFGLSVEDNGNVQVLTEKVKSGSLDGFVVYPDDTKQTGAYQVFADNTDQDNASVLSEIAKLMLQQSLLAPLESQELKSLALTGGEAEVRSYTSGKPSRDFVEYIVPGSFLVLFYTVLVFSVGYALTSVSEEKENRSIEMVLSYVKPRTLILGKLTAVILVTLTQIAFFITLGAISYLIARTLGSDLSLPFDLSQITFESTAILFGLAFLVFGFIFFVSLMATIGALFPSAKEASGFSTVFYLLPAVPFWGFNAIVNDPSSLFTQVVTYFPLSAPTAVLLRNTAGNLGIVQGMVSLAILIAATIITILLAGKAFRLGTLEYTSRIKLTALLK
jgi:ABC-2 type transport system permease protein